MKISNYYILFISFIAFFSCKGAISDPITHFNNKYTEIINHSRIINLENFGILKPIDVILADSNYVIWDGKNENIFNVLNYTPNAKIVKGVNKGNGPNDIISPSTFQRKNNNILIYDIAQKRISKIDFISDTILGIKEIQKINSDQRLFMVKSVGTNFIASGIFEDYWLANINKSGQILSKINFPYFEEIKNIPKMQLSILYISTLMASSPDNKKVVAATQKHGHISFFDYTDDGELVRYKELNYYPPKFSSTERGGIAFSKENKIGFCAIDCDNDFVYVLYSGKTFESDGLLNHHCDNLLIYDWKGNPIKRHILDIPLYSMRIDKNKRIIYGIAYQPEGILVEYRF